VRRRPAQRRTGPALGALLVLPLLAGAAACSGPSHQPRGRPAATSSSATPTPVQAAGSVPWRVRVTHVAGTLDPRRRRDLVAGVGATIGSYVDQAFISGPYPRSDFSPAFAGFTTGAARRGKADRALLTNEPLGSSTRSVVATRRTAYLSVLAPAQRPAGVTAALDLQLLVGRADGTQVRVRLHGRLLLSRDPGRPWTIFGYDLARSDVPSAGGGR
jgi:hypothetical protein